jgi:hypothetical protein
MIQLARNNKLVAAIVAMLVSVSAVGMSLTAGRGAPEHSPVIALAVLPSAARVQTKRRSTAVRSIRLRLRGWLSEKAIWNPPRGPNLRQWLPIRKWDARGPPR